MLDQPKPKPPDWKQAAADAALATANHWVAATLARSGIPADRASVTYETDYRITAEIDGERFRVTPGLFGVTTGLLGPHLMLLRPCTFCHQGAFFSGWVDTPAALGKALASFHPMCSACRRAGRT